MVNEMKSPVLVESLPLCAVGANGLVELKCFTRPPGAGETSAAPPFRIIGEPFLKDHREVRILVLRYAGPDALAAVVPLLVVEDGKPFDALVKSEATGRYDCYTVPLGSYKVVLVGRGEVTFRIFGAERSDLRVD